MSNSENREMYSSGGPNRDREKTIQKATFVEKCHQETCMYESNPLARVDRANDSSSTSPRICFDNAGI